MYVGYYHNIKNLQVVVFNSKYDDNKCQSNVNQHFVLILCSEWMLPLALTIRDAVSQSQNCLLDSSYFNLNNMCKEVRTTFK